MRNLRDFLSLLQKHHEIVEITAPVDPTLELAEIHRRVAAANGPALLFRNVENSSFPVVTNLFGSKKRVDLAFSNRPEELIAKLIQLATKEFPPSFSKIWQERKTLRSLFRIGSRYKTKAPVTEMAMPTPDLHRLPMTQSWPEDGGHFLTLPLVYTEPLNGGAPNLGIYRIQRYDASTAGLHWQIGKGGGFHHHLAEKQGKTLPVTIFLGGPPALLLSAIAPLPENVPELLLCSLLQNEKLSMTSCQETSHPLIAESEFACIGEALPHERKLEGPFGDHYGYYSLAHDFPVFRCKKIYHRKDAIFPATVVGKPIQEDFYLGEYLQKLLSPLFPVVMPGVKDLWSYGEAGFHSLGSAIVKERFYRESMVSAFRILGEGQLSLTKFLLLTDQPVNLQNFKQTLETVLERFQPETDLYLFANLSLDTLDYTGPQLNKGSRGVLLGIGDPVRTLPRTFSGTLPLPLKKAEPYCPGCLVLEAPSYKEFTDFSSLYNHPNFSSWPLLIVVDDLKKTLKNDASFLWTTFTRFEPAADIHSAPPQVVRHHLSYKAPLIIDARMKPSYPKEVLPDEHTSSLVTKRWNDYFPQGMEMGDSSTAHVC